MRTSVQPTSDPEETDEFPGCAGSVGADGYLVIVGDDEIVESTYAVGEWYSVTTHAE
jgi:hypothetical protein